MIKDLSALAPKMHRPAYSMAKARAVQQPMWGLNNSQSVIGQMANIGHGVMSAVGVNPFGTENPNDYFTMDSEKLGATTGPRYRTSQILTGEMPGAGKGPTIQQYLRTIRSSLGKHGTAYVRWSRGPEFDLKQGAVSVDKVSGSRHEGLSSVPLSADMSDGTILSRLKEYGFLRMNDPRISPTVYRGTKVGIDSDGYTLIKPESVVESLDSRFVSMLDSRAGDAVLLKEKIADTISRIGKTKDKLGLEVLNDSLAKLRTMLAEFE